ncbi:hypothetical protein cypCar_00018176 [Cyprinus carpio]|nr:hypothetical protein cypCar_00018176 [Cyprinus carpio]
MFYTLQDSPMKFLRTHMTLPRGALEKAEEVIRMYMGLMTQSDKPVDWNCEEEYTEDFPESTTEPLSQTAGSTTAESNSRSQEDRQEMKDQTHPDRETHRNSATEHSSCTIISFGTVLIITLVCGGLLLITVLFYKQQKVSDSQFIFALLKRPA